jgi:hypothetical protein
MRTDRRTPKGRASHQDCSPGQRQPDADRGRDEAIDGKQAVGVNQIADGLRRSELETTKRVLDELGGRLQGDGVEDNGKGGER